ncbi:MAG: hypothetical protein ACOC7T_00775 [Planctomycetota bacterium]
MAHRKKLEYTALAGLVFQIAFLLVCLLFAAQSHSQALYAEAWYVGIGLLVWGLVLVHGRQRRLAREEREEQEQLQRERLSEEIFDETELDTMRASSGLLIFEKYLVPFFSVVLSGVLLFAAYRLVSSIWGVALEGADKPTAVAVAMAFVGFPGFLIGKYAAGLAQGEEYRLLRAAGGYLLGNVIGAVLIAGAMAMTYFDITWGEALVTYIIPVIMGLVGVEVLLNLLLDVYRPRVPGQERRPPYDSRLLGLFAEPQGVLKTIASTLDYQFGFKVSETWFYRFMEGAIVPLLLVWVATLWLLTCIVVADQDEVVFIERLGRPVVTAQDKARGLPASVFPAGFHVKWPWPISTARHVPAYKVHSLQVGKWYSEETTEEQKEEDPYARDVILWKEKHVDPKLGFEASFLVPSTGSLYKEQAPEVEPGTGEAAAAEMRTGRSEEAGEAPGVNLARLLANVHYRVRRGPDGAVDPQAAFTYVYRQQDIKEHMQRLAYRTLCRVAASQDFLEWVAEQRAESVRRFGRMLRQAVRNADLGLEVVYVGIPSVHPPAETASAFEAVVGRMEQREALSYQGDRMSVRMVEEAKAASAEKVNEAEGYAYRLLENARAEKEKFLVQLEAYRKAPLVYEFRTYFDAVEEGLGGQKLYVLPTAAREVQIIDMKERLRPQLLDLDVEE